jgi:hypothetical protein
MLFKRRPREDQQAASDETAPEEVPSVDATILRDQHGLHQAWYLDMRLQEELMRAARTGHPFSIAAWEPQLLRNDVPDPQVIDRAAAFIANKLRSYDLVGRMAEHRFVAVLLDADYHLAKTVAYRINADIPANIPRAGKWKAAIATFGRDGVDGDSLIQAALRRLDDHSRANAA